MKKLASIIFILFAIGFRSAAQEEIKLKGKIVDSQTGESIPFCNIVNAKDPAKGTISNINGDFVFPISGIDAIYVSMLGYEPLVIDVASICQVENLTVSLTPQIIELDEAIVKATDFSALIPEVYQNISKTFSKKYPAFVGLYRKQLLEDDEYVFLGECSVFCKNSKANKNTPKVAIGDTYATVNKTDRGNSIYLTLYSNLILYPYCYFLRDSNSDDIKWTFTDAKISEDGMSQIYIMSYESKDKGITTEKGKVYINSEDKAILQVERNILSAGETQKLDKGYELTDSRMRIIYKYQKIDSGLYAIKYTRTEWNFRLVKGSGSHNYLLTNDFVVTDYNPPVKKATTDASIDPFDNKDNIQIVDKSALKIIPPDYEQ